MKVLTELSMSVKVKVIIMDKDKNLMTGEIGERPWGTYEVLTESEGL